MALSKLFRDLEETVTFSPASDARYPYYSWEKDGKKLVNQFGASLKIANISQKDYGLYTRIATASNRSEYRCTFLLQPPPTFSSCDFQRTDSYESVEAEVPPNFAIQIEDSSPASLTASVEFSSHPDKIEPYKPPQSRHLHARDIKYSSRHDLHPQGVYYPQYHHSLWIQPYCPPQVESISYRGFYHHSQAVHNNRGPSNYYSFSSPCPPLTTFPQYLYPSERGYYKTPQTQATLSPKPLQY